MSVYKNISPADISVTPFKLYKSWTVTETASISGSGVTVYDGLYIPPTVELGNSYIQPYLPTTTDGKYQFIIHNSINHLFYRDYYNSSNIFGSYSSNQKRYLSDQCTVISIPYKLYGEGIRPGSVILNGTYVDHAYGTLYTENSYFKINDYITPWIISTAINDGTFDFTMNYGMLYMQGIDTYIYQYVQNPTPPFFVSNNQYSISSNVNRRYNFGTTTYGSGIVYYVYDVNYVLLHTDAIAYTYPQNNLETIFTLSASYASGTTQYADAVTLGLITPSATDYYPTGGLYIQAQFPGTQSIDIENILFREYLGEQTYTIPLSDDGYGNICYTSAIEPSYSENKVLDVHFSDAYFLNPNISNTGIKLFDRSLYHNDITVLTSSVIRTEYGYDLNQRINDTGIRIQHNESYNFNIDNDFCITTVLECPKIQYDFISGRNIIYTKDGSINYNPQYIDSYTRYPFQLEVQVSMSSTDVWSQIGTWYNANIDVPAVGSFIGLETSGSDIYTAWYDGVDTYVYKCSDGVNFNLISTKNYNGTSFTIAPSGGLVIGTNEGYIYNSVNGGTTWNLAFDFTGESSAIRNIKYNETGEYGIAILTPPFTGFVAITNYSTAQAIMTGSAPFDKEAFNIGISGSIVCITESGSIVVATDIQKLAEAGSWTRYILPGSGSAVDIHNDVIKVGVDSNIYESPDYGASFTASYTSSNTSLQPSTQEIYSGLIINPIDNSDQIIAVSNIREIATIDNFVNTTYNKSVYDTISTKYITLLNTGTYPIIYKTYNNWITFSPILNPNVLIGSKYDGTNTVEVRLNSTELDIFNGSKHFIALQQTGSELQLFVDDTVYSTASISSLVNTMNVSDIFVGSKNGSNKWNGRMSNIKIYNRAIPVTELPPVADAELVNETRCVGNIFYDMGFITLTTPLLFYRNILTNPSSSFSLTWDSTKTVYETEIVCRVPEGEFNKTYNPSCRVNNDIRNNRLESFTTHSLFSPYITTVGLYNENLELVGVAKLSVPVKKVQNMDTNIIVRYDT